MRYSELIQLYFERSNALQWYWTLYVVIVGGLLAFSSLRKQPDRVTTVLVSVLFICFAYKNLDAIGDTTAQRWATLHAMQNYDATGPDAAEVKRGRQFLEPTLNPPEFPGVRNFHIVSDVLTLAAIWAMEWRRRKSAAPPVAA